MLAATATAPRLAAAAALAVAAALSVALSFAPTGLLKVAIVGAAVFVGVIQLEKPFTAADLSRKLRELLDATRADAA